MGNNNWLAALSAGASTLGDIKMQDTLDKRKRERDKADRLEIMQAKIDMERAEVDRQNEAQESARIMGGVKDRLAVVMAKLQLKDNTPDQVKKLKADEEALMRMSTGLLTRSLSSSDVAGELSRMTYGDKEIISPDKIETTFSKVKGLSKAGADIGNGVTYKDFEDMKKLEKSNDTDGLIKKRNEILGKLRDLSKRGATKDTDKAVEALQSLIENTDLVGSPTMLTVKAYVDEMKTVQGELDSDPKFRRYGLKDYDPNKEMISPEEKIKRDRAINLLAPRPLSPQSTLSQPSQSIPQGGISGFNLSAPAPQSQESVIDFMQNIKKPNPMQLNLR